MRGGMSRCAFPCRERDFSLLLADGVKFADVTKTIQSLGIAEILRLRRRIIPRENVPVGKYSLMVRVTLQSKAATLTDAADCGVFGEDCDGAGEKPGRDAAGQLTLPVSF